MFIYTLKMYMSTPRYSLLQLKVFKDKDKIFEAYRQKDQAIYKGKKAFGNTDFFKANLLYELS